MEKIDNNEIIGIVKNTLQTDIPITKETSLSLDLHIESIQYIQVICALEEYYNTNIAIESLSKIETINDLITTLKEELNGEKENEIL